MASIGTVSVSIRNEPHSFCESALLVSQPYTTLGSRFVEKRKTMVIFVAPGSQGAKFCE